MYVCVYECGVCICMCVCECGVCVCVCASVLTNEVCSFCMY